MLTQQDLLQSFHLEFLDHAIFLTLPCWVIIYCYSVLLGISGPFDSPDLALLCYNLFGSLEQHLVGRRLQNNEEVEVAVSECL